MSLLRNLFCCTPEFSNLEKYDHDKYDIKDLEKIVRARAWKVHLKGQGRRCTSKCRPTDKYTLELDWATVKFIAEEPNYEDDGIPIDVCKTIFETVFENNSSVAQSQTLKTERQTKSSCKCTLTKGYTIGLNVGLSIAAPKKIANLAVGFSKGFTIQHAVENLEEKTLTWSTEGTLNVQESSKVTAKLNITEEISKFTFDCRVIVQGDVKGTFYDKDRKVVDRYIGNMRTILLEEYEDAEDIKEMDNAAAITIRGRCGFQVGIKQQLVID